MKVCVGNPEIGTNNYLLSTELNSRFVRRVEEMQPRRIEGEAHALMGSYPRAGIDSRDERTVAGAHVEQDLRAERLDHLHHRLEAVVGGVAAIGWAQRLR